MRTIWVEVKGSLTIKCQTHRKIRGNKCILSLAFRRWNNQAALRRSRGSQLVATLDDGLFDTESSDVRMSDAV